MYERIQKLKYPKVEHFDGGVQKIWREFDMKVTQSLNVPLRMNTPTTHLKALPYLLIIVSAQLS